MVLKFDSNGNYLATIDGSTTPQGPFWLVAGVAVDQSGHLWTADGNTDNITEFDEDGSFVQQWTDPFGKTLAIAVDRTNSFVYLIRGSQDTERFNLTGGDETVIEANDGTQAGVALSLEPASGTLYIGHSDHVTVYDSTGAQLDSFSLNTSNSQGVAFGTTAGVLYVSDATADDVTIYGPPTKPGPPIVFSESFSDVTQTSVSLHATLVPFGLDTTCTFQYVDDAGFQANGYIGATSVPCVPADLGSGFTFVQASADVGGLTPGTTYHFRVVATNSAGTANGNDMTFKTAGPPVVVSQSATNVTDTTATLNATVNPAGLDTTCVFQYVDDAAFLGSGYSTATSVDCSPFDLGSSFDDQTTSASVNGLKPSTLYHFRVVATNSTTTMGPDATFRTLVSFLMPVGTFGSAGTASGQFQTPVGVAVYQRNGQVYVADSANARIEKFDKDGKFLAAWGWGVNDGAAMSEACKSKTACQAGLPGAGAGQFTTPTSVAVDSSKGSSRGNVYVGDAGTNVVQKFTASGKYLSTIDGSNTTQGHFVSLAGVAVDQNGNLWTVDAGTGNVAQFNEAGTFLGEWNDPSGSPGAIAVDATRGAVYLITFGTTERFTFTGGGRTAIDSNSATALALDPQTGNLYVDHGANVAIYNQTGALIDTLFSLGPTTNSQGVAYRSTGHNNSAGKKDRLYVTDRDANLVRIYGPRAAGAPFVTSESSSPIGQTGQTLKATIVPLGHKTTCTFQYVSSTDFQASGYTNATTVPCDQARPGRELHVPAGEREHQRADARRLLPLPRDRDELGGHHDRCRSDVPGRPRALDAVHALPGRRPGDAGGRWGQHDPCLPGLELDAWQHHDRQHDHADREQQPAGRARGEQRHVRGRWGGRWIAHRRSGHGHRRWDHRHRDGGVRWHALGLRLDRGAQRRHADHHAADQDPPGEPARGSGGPGAELLHRLGSGSDRPAPREHRPVERDGEWRGFQPRRYAQPERPAVHDRGGRGGPGRRYVLGAGGEWLRSERGRVPRRRRQCHRRPAVAVGCQPPRAGRRLVVTGAPERAPHRSGVLRRLAYRVRLGSSCRVGAGALTRHDRNPRGTSHLMWLAGGVAHGAPPASLSGEASRGSASFRLVSHLHSVGCPLGANQSMCGSPGIGLHRQGSASRPSAPCMRAPTDWQLA